MQAMVLKKLGAHLEWTDLADRQPGPGEIRVKVSACGVCRTDLHVVDGELPNPQVPIIPGHEIVGRIDVIGSAVEGLRVGERVGIPWLGHTCGVCPYCRGGQENLCDRPLFTGYTRDGGFATATIADARYAFPLGEVGDDVALAPLLCAGLIGWRSLVIAGEGKKLGLYGFGAAAHIVAQVAQVAGAIGVRLHAAGRCCHPGLRPEPGRGLGGRIRRDAAGAARCRDHLCHRRRSRAPGAEGGPQGRSRRLRGHPYERHPSFPYRLLWEERQLVSVANLTRQDGIDFLRLAPEIGIVTQTTSYPLNQANQALADLRAGRFEGAAVLVP